MSENTVDCHLIKEVKEIKVMLWGRRVDPDSFRRWCQGFKFSRAESTALVQSHGGPCAIMAPLQAYILKYIIAENEPDQFKVISKEEQECVLVKAMIDILRQSIKRHTNKPVAIVYRCWDKDDQTVDITSSSGTRTVTTTTSSSANYGDYPGELSTDVTCMTSLPSSESDTMIGEETLHPQTSDTIIRDAIPEEYECTEEMKQCSNDGSMVNLFLPSDRMVSEPTIDEKLVDMKPATSFDKSNRDDTHNQIEDEAMGRLQRSVSDTTCLMSELREAAQQSTSESACGAPLQTPVSEQINEQIEPIYCDEAGASGASDASGESKKLIQIDQVELRRACDAISSHEVRCDDFHRCLKIIRFNDLAEAEEFLRTQIHDLQDSYGVLLFLYSVLLTKGARQLKIEIGELNEPLIQPLSGYGSQALINLMLTGRAVQHVWDHNQHVDGLTLRGIDQQSEIGFINLMENMRYLTVGSFFKNPKYPIWILASQTHLTVLFSFDHRLVYPEQPWEMARRVFRSYDPDGNNFIPFGLLQEVLKELKLVSDPEYVEVMRAKLDSENLGIVLLNNFLDEYYPDMVSTVPETFTLWHYNGLGGSHHSNTVRYVRGNAVLLECDIKAGSEVDQMLMCLQTKWPNIEVQWETPNNKPPSLN